MTVCNVTLSSIWVALLLEMRIHKHASLFSLSVIKIGT